MSNTIKEVLDGLAEGERGWVHDQLDGTSFATESLANVDKKVEAALQDISRLLEEATPKQYPAEDWHDDITRAGISNRNAAIEQYSANLERIKE